VARTRVRLARSRGCLQSLSGVGQLSTTAQIAEAEIAMEKYKIYQLALRPDQASRLYEFGFKIRSLRGRRVRDDLDYHYNDCPLFDIELPKSAVVVREPVLDLGGRPGIARIQPKDGEGYIREFKWRPSVRGVPARMTGFVRLEEFLRRAGKKKKEGKDEDDTGADPVYA